MYCVKVYKYVIEILKFVCQVSQYYYGECNFVRCSFVFLFLVLNIEFFFYIDSCIESLIIKLQGEVELEVFVVNV